MQRLSVVCQASYELRLSSMSSPNQYTMPVSADCSVFSDWLTDCSQISPDPPSKTCPEYQIDIYRCPTLICSEHTTVDPNFYGGGRHAVGSCGG